METKKEITLEDVARILQDGLLKMDVRFKEVKADINELKTDVAGLKDDVAGLKTDVARIDATVNNIEANLNKKVDKIDHNTLDYRVEKLEEKFA